MSKVGVRYIVTDVDAAIAFYTEHLGFQVDMHPAPGFAGGALNRDTGGLLSDVICSYCQTRGSPEKSRIGGKKAKRERAVGKDRAENGREGTKTLERIRETVGRTV